MPPESASPPRSIWSSAHIAPTVGHVTLPARRPLRDGTDSTVSRGSSASRPAPGLLGKRGRSDRSGSSKSDKSSEGVKSRYSPDTVAHMPPVSGQQVTGAEASRRLPRLQTRKSLVQSSDDESLTDLSDGEGEGSPRNSSGGVVTDHTPVNGVPRTTQSPTLIQSGSSSDDSGPRFTAAQKGKGRAATTPSPQVFGSDSDVNDGLDAAMDESIQFISSAPAREVVEVIEETNGVIEEDSALSAFSRCWVDSTDHKCAQCASVRPQTLPSLLGMSAFHLLADKLAGMYSAMHVSIRLSSRRSNDSRIRFHRSVGDKLLVAGEEEAEVAGEDAVALMARRRNAFIQRNGRRRSFGRLGQNTAPIVSSLSRLPTHPRTDWPWPPLPL